MSKDQEILNFSPLIIGTMRLGEWGVNMSSNELEKFIDQCVDLGLKDFDHADIYGHYTEEGNFGKVLSRRPDLRSEVQITTKCGIKLTTERRPSHSLKSYDSTSEHIIFSAEQSLKELNIDCIDLLLIHRPDYLMDAAEVARAFEKLKVSGKVKHFGVSNFSTSQVALLQAHTPLASHQIEASLLHRNPLDDGSLDQCQLTNMIPTAWSPFGGGRIFSKDDDPQLDRIRKTALEIGEKYDAGLDQILLAWLLKHPAGIVPIVGSSKISRIETALAATKIKLSHEEWYQLLEAAVGAEVP